MDEPDRVSFTLIHFTDGDPAPSADTVKLLEGWWEVKMGVGPSRFYLFKRDGTVLRTDTKPKSNSAPMAQDTGFWFEQDFQVIYFWRKTGNLERLLTIDSRSGGVGDLVVYGVPGAKARKM